MVGIPIVAPTKQNHDAFWPNTLICNHQLVDYVKDNAESILFQSLNICSTATDDM